MRPKKKNDIKINADRKRSALIFMSEQSAGRRLLEAHIARRCLALRKRNFLKKVSFESSKTLNFLFVRLFIVPDRISECEA